MYVANNLYYSAERQAHRIYISIAAQHCAKQAAHASAHKFTSYIHTLRSLTHCACTSHAQTQTYHIAGRNKCILYIRCIVWINSVFGTLFLSGADICVIYRLTSCDCTVLSVRTFPVIVIDLASAACTSSAHIHIHARMLHERASLFRTQLS